MAREEKPLSTFEGQQAPWSDEERPGGGRGGGGRRGGPRLGLVFGAVLGVAGLGGTGALAYHLSTRLDAAENRSLGLEGEAREGRIRLNVCNGQRRQAEEAHATCERAMGPARKALEERLVALSRERCDAATHLVAELGKLQEPAKLRLWQVGAKLRLGIRQSALFDEGTAKLSPTGRLLVGQIARTLGSEQRGTLTVIAQQDGEPIGRERRAFASSWELAAARAAVIASAMVADGLPPTRVAARGLGAGSARAAAPGIEALGESRVELELELGPGEREDILSQLAPACAPAWLADAGPPGAARDGGVPAAVGGTGLAGGPGGTGILARDGGARDGGARDAKADAANGMGGTLVVHPDDAKGADEP